MGNLPWTDEQFELLRKHHAENHSFSAIARLINEETGSAFSRNACIGKSVRTGLSRPRRKPEGRRPRTASNQDRGSTQRIRITKSSLPFEPLDEPPHLGLTLLQTNNATCKFPRGEHIYTFCGQGTRTDSPYCAFHAALCYRPPESRPTRRAA